MKKILAYIAPMWDLPVRTVVTILEAPNRTIAEAANRLFASIALATSSARPVRTTTDHLTYPMLELSTTSFHDIAERRREDLNRIFKKRRRRKGEHLSKESIIIAFQNLHALERYPFGRPANVLGPDAIRKIIKGRE